MNIWEAYLEVKNGKIVRAARKGSSRIYFILQTTRIPFDEKEIVYIEISDITNAEGSILELKDIDYSPLEEICMYMFERSEFKVVSMEEMLKEGYERNKISHEEDNE